MPTIHDEIDDHLAADLHNDLSEEERTALHMHLVECATCRKIHQETKIMNGILEEKLTTQKPDGAFEQRMLAGFRTRVPARSGNLLSLLAGLMRMRATQITAVAALLLVLVQTGRMITHEGYSLGVTSQPEALAPIGQRDQKKTDANELKDEIGPMIAGRGEAGYAAKSANLADASGGLQPAAPQPPATRARHFAAADSSAAVGALDKPAEQPVPAEGAATKAQNESGEIERVIVTGSNIPVAEEVGPSTVQATTPGLANRKLIRNATVDLEIVRFDDAVQKITVFASEDRGYVATTSSEKQENGKLNGEIVVKVLPENLDRFLQKLRGLGDLKNQTLGTDDVTKDYFDTDARLKNAHVMEQRLIDMLKTKTGKVSDLLQVEKELGRVREEIEKMQGELKFWDSEVQFATVTISLAEKDMDQPAAFLLKEQAQLSLYTPEVEKIYNEIKSMASPKVQITNAQLNRDNTGRVSARISILIAPEEGDGVIGKVKTFGRVENFQTQTQRVAQGGEGLSEEAKTKRDKVELNITISREEQEQALQQTSLSILTSAVDEKAGALRALAEKQNGRVRSSTFSRDPDGRESANISLRVPMANYAALLQSLKSLGKVENVSVQRQDRNGPDIDLATAPADLSIQVYSQGSIVSPESGLLATLRRTIAQSAGAITWSLRMIGVAIAFFAPWVIALLVVIWIAKRILRARK